MAFTAAAAGEMPLAKYSQLFDFDKRCNFRGSKSITLVDSTDSGKAMQIATINSKAYAYSNMAMPLNVRGTLVVSFDLKNTLPEKAKFSLRVNFNAPGKGNGSAGHGTAMIDSSESNKRVYRVFDVPANTGAIQYVFNLSGTDFKAVIDNFSVIFTPDSITVPLADKVDFNAPASAATWNPMNLSYGMFTQGKPAAVASSMQAAADKQGLYLLFRNFVDPESIKSTVTSADGDLWADDSNEIFFFDEGKSKGWQFIVNSIGSGFDGELYMRMPGDPWRTRTSWNGVWQKAGKKTDYGFETRFFIPWSTIGIDPVKGGAVAFNAGGDYPSNSEFPTWCSYRGTRFDIGKYGKLVLENNKLTITRSRHTEDANYAVKRPNAKYKQLLKTGTPGNYKIEFFTLELGRHDYPKNLMSRVSDEQFYAWQDELLRAYHELDAGGPRWPWTFAIGKKRIKELADKGMKFPLTLSNSTRVRHAREAGAKLINANSRSGVDSNDPAFVNVLSKSLYDYRKHADYEFVKKSVNFIMGIDEPTNSVEICYDPAQNAPNKEHLKLISEKVSKEYGFGKYGIPFIPEVTSEELPFARIAFYRYWNNELLKNFTHIQNVAKEVFPDAVMNIFDDNNCSGQSTIDAANFNGTAKLIACDCYPTSTAAHYGKSRAIYHTGFSCRVMSDLVPSAKLMLIPQGFVYHGGHGNEAAMREWVSQGLKNGAEWFMWYCESAPHKIFKDFSDMLEISAEIKQMDKLVLPEKTNTLLFYSCFDKWAKADPAMHSTYSTYVMLAEVAGCNFRIFSETSLLKNHLKLEDYKLIFVPSMTYTTNELAGKFADWVKNGGTIVTFDPNFMAWNNDGTANKLRKELTGLTGLPAVRQGESSYIRWNGKSLACNAITNAPPLRGNSFAAYHVDNVDGKVIMRYADGKPAAWERKVGKGRVIAFAIQPFAGSDVAIQPGAWRDFFAGLARAHGEAIDLPVRDFLIPKVPARIKLKNLLSL